MDVKKIKIIATWTKVAIVRNAKTIAKIAARAVLKSNNFPEKSCFLNSLLALILRKAGFFILYT